MTYLVLGKVLPIIRTWWGTNIEQSVDETIHVILLQRKTQLKCRVGRRWTTGLKPGRNSRTRLVYLHTTNSQGLAMADAENRSYKKGHRDQHYEEKMQKREFGGNEGYWVSEDEDSETVEYILLSDTGMFCAYGWKDDEKYSDTQREGSQ